jgi:L-aminopeptidase/D-esterase-like protein
MTRQRRISVVVATIVLLTAAAGAQRKERAREMGIPFEGTPGQWNAITDVAGVEVGLTTLISGNGPLKAGAGPVRTGVTAILPRGKASKDPVFASWFSINGNGEMTGTTWIEEGGFLEGPLFITNTHSVGTVRSRRRDQVGGQPRHDAATVGAAGGGGNL